VPPELRAAYVAVKHDYNAVLQRLKQARAAMQPYLDERIRQMRRQYYADLAANVREYAATGRERMSYSAVHALFDAFVPPARWNDPEFSANCADGSRNERLAMHEARAALDCYDEWVRAQSC
jgi:hypothetical protein